jgi:hypothetical protein
VNGNEYFDYLHETNGIYLANSLLSDFNGPNEKSLQISLCAEHGALRRARPEVQPVQRPRLGHRRHSLG